MAKKAITSAKKKTALVKKAPAKLKLKKAVSVKKKVVSVKVKKVAPAAKKVAPKAKRTVVKKTATASKKKVSAIPKGYNTVTPCLVINNAAKAIQFYKKVFGAKEVLRMDQPNGKVGHAELKLGDAKIMLADECSEMKTRSPKALGGSPVSIHLYVKNVDTIVKGAVSAGAKLLKPVEDMYYGDRCGTLEDPYGHQWHVSTHIEDVTPAKLKKRAAELYGKKK